MPNIPNDPIMLMSYLNTPAAGQLCLSGGTVQVYVSGTGRRSPQSWKQLASYTSRNAISLYRSLCSKIRA